MPREWNPQPHDCEYLKLTNHKHFNARSESVKASAYVYRSYAMQAFVIEAPMPESDPMKAKIWQPVCPAANPLLNEL